MTAKKNKVKFNLKNAYYAKILEMTQTNMTFDTPVPLPGAVSLSLDANGENENFYADGGVYYVISNNQGYEGDFELAMIPESFRIDILGEALDKNKVLFENANVETSPFAFLFEFDGDVTIIPRSVFSGCSTLTSITLPNSVQNIKDYSFENCSSLATIAIPESVTTIGQAVFSGCTSLESFTGKFASADGACLIIDGKLVAYATDYNTIYTIPSTVSTIAKNAFKGNNAITTVTIPESVNTIEAMAFIGCSNLKSITLLDAERVPKGADGMFDDIADDAKIYVPVGTVDKYKEAWQSFGYEDLITEIANE